MNDATLMSRQPRTEPDDAAPDGRELSAIRPELARSRAVLEGLQRDIAAAERQLGSNQCAQLVEANELLLAEVLRARAAAETAAQALLEATRAGEVDVLTQLPNRVLLMDRRAQAMAGAQRRGARAAVLFLDLNGFKQVNDRLGHAVGDRVLKEVANRLASCIRAADTVSRHGGDEFLVVMAEIAQAEDALLIADKLGSALAEPCRVGEHVIEMSASIGISLFPDDGEDAVTLIDHADAAMYKAKLEGLCSCFYGAAMPAASGAGPQPPAPDLRVAAEPPVGRQVRALGFVAHELRNPLMALRAAAESLRQGADEAVRQRLLAVVDRQLDHMARMVDDLGDLARTGTGKMRLERGPVDLAELTAQAVLAFQPKLRSRCQTLEMSVQPGSYLMHGDAVRLTQVISNLLDNATRYTPVDGKLSLSLAASEQWLVLTVSDNGIGITAEVLPRVFEPFVQGGNPAHHDRGGLGLGLALVRELVAAHGGSVIARSAGLGCGSRFVVELPAGPVV
jgi:diguanylate cyclase (GGDEF)-like protein